VRRVARFPYRRLRYHALARRVVREAAAGGRPQAPRGALVAIYRELARPSLSVLDIGTGRMNSLVDCPCPVQIGLDAHRPYLERRSRRAAVPLNASALEVERLFVAGAVDLVTLMDVLEHFERAEAEEVLRQAESAAARRVVLFTPRGEFPPANFDPSDLGGEELQRHRSVWEPEDLEALGYRVIVMSGYHGPGNPAFVEAFGADAPPVDALLAWRDTSSANSV
jgi:hypothetical protein